MSDAIGGGSGLFGGPALAVFSLATRRQRWRTLAWMAFYLFLFGVGVYAYEKAFPDYFQRQVFAASVEGNLAFRMLYGPARSLDTPGGFIAWRYGFGSIVGAVWGLLTSTSLLCGEEESGRWELVVSGAVSKLSATAAVLGSIVLNLAAMAVLSWMVLVAGGLSARASAFFAAAFFLPALTFTGVGGVLSQLSPTRRSAAAVSGLILGVTFLVRIVANGARTFEWVAWLSPSGWYELSHVYTGSHILPLAAGYSVSAGLLAAALSLARGRDLGAGVIGRYVQRSGVQRRAPGSPLGAAVRELKWSLVAWMSAMVVASIVFGILTKDFVEFIEEQGPALKQFMEQMAGIRLDSTGFAGFLLSFASLPIGVFAALQVGPMCEEEEEYRLDLVLSQPVARSAWYLSRVGVAAAAIVALALATTLGLWVGGSLRGVDLSLAEMIGAAGNSLPVAFLTLSAGCLVFGIAPRIAVGVAVGGLLGSFMLNFIGALARLPNWVLSLSPFRHVAPYPALPVNWTGLGVMILVGCSAILAGGVGFSRRDIKGS